MRAASAAGTEQQAVTTLLDAERRSRIVCGWLPPSWASCRTAACRWVAILGGRSRRGGDAVGLDRHPHRPHAAKHDLDNALNLNQLLSRQIFGQQTAIDEIAQAVRISRAPVSGRTIGRWAFHAVRPERRRQNGTALRHGGSDVRRRAPTDESSSI